MKPARIAFVLLFLAAASGSSITADPGVDIHVSTRGNDSWSGMRPEPDAAGTDGPFLTLERAKDAIRSLKARGNFTGPVRVLVQGGHYTLTRPLVLDSRDSGEDGRPVSYSAYGGQRPVFSGGMRVDGWSPYKGSILRAPFPAPGQGTWKPRQLFYKGKRQRMARFPNFDPGDPLYGGWAFVDEAPPESFTTAFKYEAGTFPRSWSSPGQGLVSIFPWYCWVNDIVPIANVDTGSRTISLARPLGHTVNDMESGKPFMSYLKGNRFYVENLLEELDQPGEWCWDDRTGSLYFWPPDTKPEAGSITVPAILSLIELKGEPGRPVHDVSISGMEFTQTRTDWPEVRATSFHSPARHGHAIRLENAERCTIQGNRILAPGADGIRLEGYNAGHVITENEIDSAGGSGISVVTGDVPANTNSWKNRSDLDNRYSIYRKAVRNTISRNHIHHCGQIKKNGAGVQFFGVASVDNVLSENVIHDMPDKAVTLQDGLGRVIVEKNFLYRLALEISDTGAIMTNRWFPYEGDAELNHGNVFRFNRILDVTGCGAYGTPRETKEPIDTKAGGRIWTPYFAWGIYLDNSGTKVTVYGNIVARNVLGGFGMPVGDPRDNVVENNIFVESSSSQAYLRLATASGFTFRNNIIYYRNPTAALFRINGYNQGAIAEFDRNIYYHAGRDDFRIDGTEAITFEDWRKMGHDRRSTVADPLFIDVSKDDYRLRPESPALRLGFKPIDKDVAPARRP